LRDATLPAKLALFPGSGARPLSIDMIRALHTHLGIPAEVLIGAEPAVHSRAPITLSKAAQTQLSKLGLLRARETFEDFLRRSRGDLAAPAMLRAARTERTSSKTDQTAVQAWCAAVLLRSQDAKMRAAAKLEEIDSDVARGLAKLSVRVDGPSRAVGYLADLGISFVVLPHLAGTHLDGAALMRSDRVPVIAVTLRRDRIDNLR